MYACGLTGRSGTSVSRSTSRSVSGTSAVLGVKTLLRIMQSMVRPYIGLFSVFSIFNPLELVDEFAKKEFLPSRPFDEFIMYFNC